MKPIRVLIGTGALLLFAAQAPAQTIVGTKHDMSGKGWGTNQVCVFCHAPHNAQTGQYAPLWNHANTVATFQVYASSTLNATGLAPGAQSKACLSCHDGTVAIDSYGGRTGTNFMPGTPGTPGSKNVGTDLRDDHPVGFTYDTTLATTDGGLFDPTSKDAGLGGTPNTIQARMLFADKLECASCHNVHNNQHAPFLKKSNAVSALCLTCHNK